MKIQSWKKSLSGLPFQKGKFIVLNHWNLEGFEAAQIVVDSFMICFSYSDYFESGMTELGNSDFILPFKRLWNRFKNNT